MWLLLGERATRHTIESWHKGKRNPPSWVLSILLARCEAVRDGAAAACGELADALERQLAREQVPRALGGAGRVRADGRDRRGGIGQGGWRPPSLDQGPGKG